MDHGQCPRAVGIVSPIPTIIDVVDNHARIAIIAERCPAEIIIAPVPAHPGRSPEGGGNPVPAESIPPVPSSVVEGAPAPGFIRNPCPASKGHPDPSPVEIRTPERVDALGNPDIAVRQDVDPIAVS